MDHQILRNIFANTFFKANNYSKSSKDTGRDSMNSVIVSLLLTWNRYQPTRLKVVLDNLIPNPRIVKGSFKEQN